MTRGADADSAEPPGTRQGRIDLMEKYLDDYIGRMKTSYSGFPPTTAHEIASAFLAFKFGLYENATRECTHAIALIPDSGPNAALKKALTIVRANAGDRNNAQVTADLSVSFSPEENVYTAIHIPLEQNEDPGTLDLDNALILIYVVALLTSPDDEEPLDEHRRTILRLLTDYKKAMGMD
jgi:hypothetical protein